MQSGRIFIRILVTRGQTCTNKVPLIKQFVFLHLHIPTSTNIKRIGVLLIPHPHLLNKKNCMVYILTTKLVYTMIRTK